MNNRLIGVALAAMLIAGCNSTAQNERPTKARIDAAMTRCLKSIALMGPGLKSELRTLTRASDANLARVTCDRLFKAILSGRISLPEIDRMQRGHGSPLYQILKGN